MLARIAAFEARYLLRNPLLWCTALATFLLPFASLAFGLEMEEDIRVFRNSPWEIVSKYRIISCLFMFVTTAFVANAVLRDDDTGFGPILRSTGIRQGDYLLGRFLGAFGIAALRSGVVQYRVASAKARAPNGSAIASHDTISGRPPSDASITKYSASSASSPA